MLASSCCSGYHPVIDGAYFVEVILKISHGFLTALVFFYRSREAQKLWIGLICPFIVYDVERNIEEVDIERDASSIEIKHSAFQLRGESSDISIESFSCLHRESSQTLS